MSFDFELDREQSFALGALALLVLLCGAGASAALGAWCDAADEADQRRGVLAQVEAAQRRGAVGAGRVALAPDAAFLVAPTQGQANALLQAHVTRLVVAQRASVGSAVTQPPMRDDASDVVRMRATFDMGLSALQATLYELETGAPYVFVDGLVLAPQRGAQRGAEATLHVTLDMRALWRRTRR